MARRYYNGTVHNLNVLVQSFPSNLIAGVFGFSPRDFYELDDAGARNAPRVSLRLLPSRQSPQKRTMPLHQTRRNNSVCSTF